MKNYKYKKNNNIPEDEYQLSSNKENNVIDENYYLTKYHKMFGNSLNDSELLDIIIKNNYNDKQIIEEIKSKLRNEKKYDYYNTNNNNYNNYNAYERNNFKSKSKSRGKKNKYEKRPFTKCIEIPSDYAPPPKKEEESNDDKNIGSQNEDQEINNNKKNENKMCDYKKETLLAYKENLFRILKNPEYSYKTNKNKNDEININDYDNENLTKKIINLNDKNKNIKIENNSPGPECKPNKKSKINQIINKDLKKKYIRDFFGNMKNYTNNIRRADWEKSPDLKRRENILDTSPDKEDDNRKILTYKKGIKNYYSNESDYKNNKLNKYKEYKYLQIDNKVNDIFISACYDNPQRDQYLKLINEKRKQNPDKVIEFLIPQFPPMFPMTPYQNMYSQYNPYMNMYMMPPPQIPNPMMNIMNNNNNPVQNANKNNNNTESNETPECQNTLTQTQVMQLNNNNQINVKINNTPNPNALLINNNNDTNNSKSKNSSENASGNSGNHNIDANIHL
jgi:hypothetical protein